MNKTVLSVHYNTKVSEHNEIFSCHPHAHLPRPPCNCQSLLREYWPSNTKCQRHAQTWSTLSVSQSLFDR